MYPASFISSCSPLIKPEHNAQRKVLQFWFKVHIVNELVVPADQQLRLEAVSIISRPGDGGALQLEIEARRWGPFVNPKASSNGLDSREKHNVCQ